MEEEILQWMDQEEVRAKSIEELEKSIKVESSDTEDYKETKTDTLENDSLQEKMNELNQELDEIPDLQIIEPDSNNTSEPKIVLYRSTEPLSENHQMFKQHKNVKVFRDTDKTFNYMIGGYLTH